MRGNSNSRLFDTQPRRSGILVHLTSLPGPHGIGDLGLDAHRFADFLAECGQSSWQVLPIGPAGSGNSPYQAFSAFAGNPFLISLELLRRQKFLSKCEITGSRHLRTNRVRYGAVKSFKEPLLRLAYQRFEKSATGPQRQSFASFCRRNAWWLEDYVLFTVISQQTEGAPWTDWEKPLRRRERRALSAFRRAFKNEIACERFIQFEFSRQWQLLKATCNAKQIKIIGDVAIFVAHNSADVWAHPELFDLDSCGHPRFVAGVPPDFFSASGQLWGNPLYRWHALRRTGYRWWIARLEKSLEFFDILRLDHFRGFEKYWRVKAGEHTAIRGKWIRGPGADFFRTILRRFRRLPIIAEDLGVITPEVEALREQFGFPGMRVLQFAFGRGERAQYYLPHNYTPDSVVYTATHDNDTTVGWFNSSRSSFSTRSAKELRREKQLALRYIGSDGRSIHWEFIRLAFTSVADLAVIPLQDLLGLDSKARMNRPGTAFGNWEWRFTWKMLRRDIRQRLKAITEITQRAAPRSRGRRKRGRP